MRVSAPIELWQGSGCAAPGFFWQVLLPRVHFYNRVHFFTPVLKMPKMVLYRFPNLQGRSQDFWTGGGRARARAKRVRLARRRRFFIVLFTVRKTLRRNLAIEFSF